MDLHVAGGGQSQDGYSYLCRLEELRQWMHGLLHEEVPKASDLETRLMNGVLLVKVGKILLPDDPMWRKAYDLDEKKYKARGAPDFRHTDNINFWLQSLRKLGLPDVFYPQTTDIFEAKNMPKLIFCLHALSHYSARQGQVEAAVPNLEGRATFTEEEITEASDRVANTNLPSFGVVEDLVDEEMQYQAMGEFVSPQQLEELRQQHTAERERRVAQENIYDPVARDSPDVDEGPAPPVPIRRGKSQADDEQKKEVAALYDASDNVKKQLQHMHVEDGDEAEAPPPLPERRETSVLEVQCSGEGITASLYSAVDKNALQKARDDAMTPQEKAIAAINKAITDSDAQALMKALHNPDADLPDVFSEPDEYLKDLVAESKASYPVNMTPVFAGINREKSEELLSSLSPGALLVRSGSQDGEMVVSFRNRTGIKHWKIGMTPDGKYFFGASPRFDNIGDFMQQFMTSLSSSTGLRTYYANDQTLKPKADDQARLHGDGSSEAVHLEREYIERVVAQVNKRIRSKLISMMQDGDEDSDDKVPPPAAAAAGAAPLPPTSRRPTLKSKTAESSAPAPQQTGWTSQLLTRANREQAEQLLMKHGTSGSYIVRISDRGVDQFSISFRLHNELRHWRVMKEKDMFHIPPNSVKLPTLEALVALFEKIEHAPGVKMSALMPKEAKPAAQAAPPPASGPRPAVQPLPVQQASPPPLPPDPDLSPTQPTAPAVAPAPPSRNVPVPAARASLSRKMSVKSSGGSSVSEWTVEEVERWLVSVGLGVHTAVFMENYVDGPCLLEITDSQLKNDMGITALGHRNQILRKIKALSTGI